MKALTNNKLRVFKVDSYERLADRSLEIFMQSAAGAISEKGRFNIAISGGKTPRRFYELLAEEDKVKNMDWDKIHLFWVDERCVEPDSPESNYYLAAETFLSSVPIKQENVHRIAGEQGNYVGVVAEYAKTLSDVFELQPGQLPVFDLIMLGMGPDGHIASLLPNSYALLDTDDIVSVVYQMEGGLDRITLTHPVLCAAKEIVIMISGGEKAEIVRDVLTGKQDEIKYPVHTLWPILHKVSWIIDEAAAKYL